jgi:hypothetical protein
LSFFFLGASALFRISDFVLRISPPVASKSKATAAQIAAAAPLRTAGAWLRGSRRNVLLVLISIGVLSFAALEAWRQYGASHAHVEAYMVGPQGIEVTPPPPWVRAGIKNEVIRLGSLEQVSLLEIDTSRRVAQAFALHPWVHQVRRVSKHYPASITVDVAYRRPVAVVEVERGDQPGLLPIDRDGILLPPEDFSVAQVKSLPRIAVGTTFPAGSVGTAWGDDRVAAAALVAEVLCDDWPHAPLYQIAALPAIAGSANRSTAFEIVARDGRRFGWGTAPSKEAAGEQSSAEKRLQLLKWIAEK